MIFRCRIVTRQCLLPFVAILGINPIVQADLRHSCTLKAKGYELEKVLGVVQQAVVDKPEKEAPLSNMAIEIYIDAAIETADQARAVALEGCER